MPKPCYDVIEMIYGKSFSRNIKDALPKTKTIISIDSGIKNLGICVASLEHFYIIPDITSIISNITSQHTVDITSDVIANLTNRVDMLQKIYTAIDYVTRIYLNMVNRLINIKYLKTLNIANDDKKRDIHKIANNLHNNLTEIDNKYDITHMLYEYQMIANDKSRTVSHFIIYHYNKIPITCIRGAHKNEITLTKTLEFRNYIAKYSRSYDARKHHATDSLNYWLRIFNGCNHDLIKKKDDVGDAFMQLLAHIQQ